MAFIPTTSTRVVSHYALRRKLGEGAVGEVWLARDKLLGRDAAIKMVRGGGNNERLAKDLLREAQLAAKLNHPNAITIFEVGTDRDTVFIAMEYVEAGSLADELRQHGALPWREAARAIRDAAAALQAAHEMGLVHRDVKPSNLMRNSRGLVKVVDFGLAKATDGAPDETQSAAGMIVGSPAYMSPEQCRGEPVDYRADIYSLTCTFHHLLTREVPYPAPDVPSVLYKHVHEVFPDLRSTAFEVPDGIHRIIAKGSQKNREDRYQSADAYMKDLDAVLATPEASHTYDVPIATVVNPLEMLSVAVGATEPVSRPSAVPASRRPTARAKTKRVMGPMSRLALIAVGVVIVIELVLLAFVHRAPEPADQSQASTTPQQPVQSPNQPPDGSTAPEGSGPKRPELPPNPLFKTAPDAPVSPPTTAASQPSDDDDPHTRPSPGVQMVTIRPTPQRAPGFVAEIAELRASLKVANSLEAYTRGVGAGLALVDRAATAGDDATVSAVSNLVRNAAIQSKEIQLYADVKDRLRPLKNQRAPWEAYNAALATLKQKKDDPEASLAAGRYLCFIKDDWKQGLPHLANASDPALKTLAARDLATKDPFRADGPEMLGIGDAWFDLAARHPKELEGRAQRRAAAWYNAAVPKLTAEKCQGVLTRLNALPRCRFDPVNGELVPMETSIDLLGLIDPKRDGIDGQWEKNDQRLSIDADFDPGSLIRLPYLPPLEYDLYIRFTFASTTETGHGLINFILSHRDRQFGFLVHSDGATGLAMVADKGSSAQDNPTTRRLAQAFVQGEQHVTLIKVRNDRITAAIDGIECTSFPTDYSTLTKNKDWLTKDNALYLRVQDCGAEIHSWAITDVTGSGRIKVTREDE